MKESISKETAYIICSHMIEEVSSQMISRGLEGVEDKAEHAGLIFMTTGTIAGITDFYRRMFGKDTVEYEMLDKLAKCQTDAVLLSGESVLSGED